MKPVKILQFTERDALEISSVNNQRCGPLVTLLQRADSMTFQFDMAPEQARAMGVALIQHANALEAA